MKDLKLQIWLVLFGTSILSACNNNDDNSTISILQQFSSNTGDSKEIMNPDSLQQDLSSLFGKADAEPVAVNARDKVQAIIDRAKAN